MPPSFFSTMCLLASLMILGCFIHISTPRHDDAATESTQQIRLYFSLRDPVSLFFPTATISLTDDNSTFFNAKPAAFGPPLPPKGLSGPIWIGNGFPSSSFGRPALFARHEGELGCEDDDLSPEDLLEPDIPQSPDNSPPSKSRNSSEIAGKIALLSRGGCGFSEKVKWAQRRGASAVIVGDNVPGGPLVRMYASGDISNISIPSIFTSHTTAHLLSSLIPPEFAHFPVFPDDGRNDGSDSAIATNKNEGDEFAHDSASRTAPKHGAPRTEPHHPPEDDPSSPPHEGLWVTLTQSEVNASPFFNTLFVLVVSPLLTLAVVYSMLLLRSRIRRRRWRAPKSLVERLPVHVYHSLSSGSGTGAEEPSQETCTDTTPLLRQSQSAAVAARHHSSCLNDSALSPSSSCQYGSMDASSTEQEKIDAGLAEWRRKYSGKQKECVVCLDEYIDGVSRVMSLPCGHEFHADCMRRTCPICKGDVVRSMSRISEHTGQEIADETEEDIQIQAAETINRSPSAAMPIPHPLLDHDGDVERGDGSLSIFSGLGSPPSWMSRNNSRANRGFGRGGLRNHDRDQQDEPS